MEGKELMEALEEWKKGKETTKPECSCGNCKPSIITAKDILAASTKPKEVSGAEAIMPLFKSVIPKADNPCEGCDGTDCPLLEKAGVTCMGIEGLEVIPSTGVIN